MSVNIYSANCQPATRFVDRCTEREIVFECSPYKRIRTRCCKQMRQARYVEVQVYYDGIMCWPAICRARKVLVTVEDCGE